MSSGTSGPFNSFNARAMSARLVARTFIPPKQYETLTKAAHTMVVGPRGSGKTTLLKMLTPEALTDQEAQVANAGLPLVPFTGVFIPTDISWSSQLKAYRELGIPEEYGAALVRATFTTAVLRAFVTSLQQRVEAGETAGTLLDLTPLVLTGGQEELLVTTLANLWRVKPELNSMLGLRLALSARLAAIAEFGMSERRRESVGRADRFGENSDLDLSLLPSLTAALDALEAVIPETMGERWALLFDELELAPHEIRAELIEALRSVDERLLFKLSLSPFSEEFSQFTSVLSAMPGHDHDEVSLSYGRKEEGQQFSLALMAAIVQRFDHQPSDLETLFGVPDFPVNDGPGANTNRLSPRVHRAFRQLYRDDITFREFVDRHGNGSLNGYLSLEGDRRAQVVRKVVPIVIVRAAFRVADDSEVSGIRRFKTRKNPDIYRGYSSMATLLEGNPRFIIGVMTTLLSQREKGTIGGPAQAVEIAGTVSRFRALPTTIPGPSGFGPDRRALLGLIDVIGEYFRDAIIAEDFNPDPVGSFTVDSTANPALLEALGQLANAGALVYVPDPTSGPIMTSLRGKRFRLNYLLASHYGLPLRLERSAALSRVLAGRSRHEAQFEQSMLFGESGEDS